MTIFSENTSNSENMQSTESSSFRTDDLDKTLETSDTTNHNQSESDTSRSILRSDSPSKPPVAAVNPTTLNRTKSMNSANNRTDSVDKSDFNSSESVGSACNKTHRKQHSMSNESFQQKEQTQQERKLSDLNAAGRRAGKKTRVS